MHSHEQNDTRLGSADVRQIAHVHDGPIDAPPGDEDVRRSTHPLDLVISRIASRQKGLVTYRQMLGAGIGRGAIERRVSRGSLHRVFRGVYLVGHQAMAPLVRELAAVLAYEPHAVLSYRSAIGVWQFLPKLPELIDVTVPGRHSGSQPGIVVHRAGAVARTRVHGIPITTAATTLLDFAETAEDRDLERAFGEAQARNLISPQQIRDLLDRSPGRRGTPRLTRLLDRSTGPQLSRSGLEELMLELIRAARLPEPEMNVLILNRYRVDFLWREQRVIAETDGGGWHASKRRQNDDHRRDSELRAAGWTVERFTDHELTYEPHAAVARLARAL